MECLTDRFRLERHDSLEAEWIGRHIVVAGLGGRADRDTAGFELGNHRIGIAVRQAFWV